MKKIPEFISIDSFNKKDYSKTLKLLGECKLNTVCIEANCPNRYECFSNGKATFMILGDVCTRNCAYCNIKKGKPKKIDLGEPKRIAHSVKLLGLNYVVITCVTRDDLKDGGANHFVKTIREIKKSNPKCKIEVLISDLNGDEKALRKIIKSKPYVINHNIEVVKKLFPKLRPKGNYQISLELLKKAKEINPKIITKSGFMLGFGETGKEIIQTLKDLHLVNCDIVTIGQYLQPSKEHFFVKKYYSLTEFKKIEKIAKSIGFKQVLAGPLVRSSYMAEKVETSGLV